MLGAEWKDFDIEKVKQRVKAMIEGLKFERCVFIIYKYIEHNTRNDHAFLLLLIFRSTTLYHELMKLGEVHKQNFFASKLFYSVSYPTKLTANFFGYLVNI